MQEVDLNDCSKLMQQDDTHIIIKEPSRKEKLKLWLKRPAKDVSVGFVIGCLVIFGLIIIIF